MTKRYRAEHITVFAVYKLFKLLGNNGRYLKVAFPDYADAEAWVAEHWHDNVLDKKEDYMIEEMPAIMKAWESKQQHVHSLSSSIHLLVHH